MVEQGLGIYIIILLILVLFLVASIFIPFYGFILKRWKGLALGCLIQPFFTVLVCILAFYCIDVYSDHSLHKHKKAAMVTVRKAEADSIKHTWYVKPNEECFYECAKPRHYNPEYVGNDMTLFDVIPLDSFRVCVDDKIIIRFDLKEHKVSATEYDEPIEVVNVDWDKVTDYFGK